MACHNSFIKFGGDVYKNVNLGDSLSAGCDIHFSVPLKCGGKELVRVFRVLFLKIWHLENVSFRGDWFVARLQTRACAVIALTVEVFD